MNTQLSLTWATLPVVILDNIFLHAASKLEDYVPLQHVCKEWRIAINQDKFLHHQLALTIEKALLFSKLYLIKDQRFFAHSAAALSAFHKMCIPQNMTTQELLQHVALFAGELRQSPKFAMESINVPAPPPEHALNSKDVRPVFDQNGQIVDWSSKEKPKMTLYRRFIKMVLSIRLPCLSSLKKLLLLSIFMTSTKDTFSLISLCSFLQDHNIPIYPPQSCLLKSAEMEAWMNNNSAFWAEVKDLNLNCEMGYPTLVSVENLPLLLSKLQNCKKLQCINFQGMQFTETALRALVDFVEKTPSLKEVHLTTALMPRNYREIIEAAKVEGRPFKMHKKKTMDDLD